MMESVEDPKSDKSTDSSCCNCINVKPDGAEIKQKLIELPDVLEYINRLERTIKRHLKKIDKLRNKLKCKNKKEVSTQTDFEENVTTNVPPTIENNVNSEKTLVEDITEAAQQAVQGTGFVYEETSGLYYDYNTGYYYNAEYGLYYDGSSGSYLQYNADTQTYDFHSQVCDPTGPRGKDKAKRKTKHKHKTKEAKRPRNTDDSENLPEPDIEDGECSTTEGSCSDDDGKTSDSSDISKSWPPCMRIIVESTEIPSLKIGSLHIITCSGGTIGREGDHSIILRDVSTSKHHLKINFDEKTSQYFAVDLGSRNGTLLNGKRMASSKQESESMPIAHASKIQIGQTVLLCHIHDGSQTCGHCEPGLVQRNAEPEKQKVESRSRSVRHKHELNNIKMLYGVSDYTDDPKLASGYTDRAQKRRETVGSQNPHEKTQVASVDESINKENKGFKLLEKMGWKEGQSLGKAGDGCIEPIKPIGNEGTAGIGSTNVFPDKISSGKQIVWKKTKERFQQLPESDNAFDIDTDDETKS